MSFPSFVSIPSISLFDGQLILTGETIVTVLANIIIMLVLTLFTSHTKMGKAMRAVSAKTAGAAELMGIKVNATISLTFAIGSALAAIAGVLLCSTYHTLIAHDGFHAGHQGVHGGGFRRHRFNSRRAARRHAAGHHRDSRQGVCVHGAGPTRSCSPC